MKEALVEQLGGNASKPEEKCLVLVPSHFVGKWSKSLLQVAKNYVRN